MAQCDICGQLLSVSDDPRTEDCGGTCLACMANAGDPDCIIAMKQIDGEKLLVRVTFSGGGHVVFGSADPEGDILKWPPHTQCEIVDDVVNGRVLRVLREGTPYGDA